jgi:hypothetical protein
VNHLKERETIYEESNIRRRKQAGHKSTKIKKQKAGENITLA